MLLQTVRPNNVQSIRAYRVEDLAQAAQAVGQHFLYVNLTAAQSKQDVLDAIAAAFLFPPHFGKNLDALYDCVTDLEPGRGPAGPGLVLLVEHLPEGPGFDAGQRDALLEVFRDAADWFAERGVAFRVFHSVSRGGPPAPR